MFDFCNKFSKRERLKIAHEIFDKPSCKGVIFKARVTLYQTNKGFEQRISMVQLKRNSCLGCHDCGWYPDLLNDFISEGYGSIDLSEVVDGNLYQLFYVLLSDDDFDLILKEVENENPTKN